jgi:hypothetical protein
MAPVVRPAWLAIVVATSSVLVAMPARAYRPFDGTDADVAELGDFELELGPTQWLSQGGAQYVLEPATVLNLGFLPGWEAVVDVQNSVALRPPAGQPREQLIDTDALLKTVLLRGSLQGAGPGPSVAAEFGPLLPNLNEDESFGASLDVIVTQHWREVTVHLNTWIELSRGRLQADWFEGAIVEGNTSAVVRPVSEWFVDREFATGTTTFSGLVGGIWRAHEGLDIDAAVREASTGGQATTEVRFGLTWTIGVWQSTSESGHASRTAPSMARSR